MSEHARHYSFHDLRLENPSSLLEDELTKCVFSKLVNFNAWLYYTALLFKALMSHINCGRLIKMYVQMLLRTYCQRVPF